MPKLSATKVQNIKPDTKAKKYYDENGLFLWVRPATKKSKGGKYWRFKYHFMGKEKLFSIGVYPAISLARARELRDDAKTLLAKGIDPSQQKQIDEKNRHVNSENTFKAIAEEWILLNSDKNANEDAWSDGYLRVVKLRMANDVYPFIGERPINEITSPELITVIDRIIERGATETARRVLSFIGQVFRYAVRTAKAELDISASLRGLIKKSKNRRHFSAITKPEPFGQLIANIREYNGHIVIRTALQILPYVFTRPGELRYMQWSEIDFESALWVIPKHKMKSREQDHIVPLATQALALIESIKPFTGAYKFVFCGIKSTVEPFSENALRVALRNMGYGNDDMTAHGFRASARTLIEERLKWRYELIEHQLSHLVKMPNGRAYSRAEFLDERKEMMQSWADYIDGLANKNY